MKGEKLVGWGAYYMRDFPSGARSQTTSFWKITNPDCVDEITIEKISIISGNGTGMYEGPILGLDGTPLPDTMQPHEIRIISLSRQVANLPNSQYTVEVYWSAPNNCLPLIGYGEETPQRWDADGKLMYSRVHMIPMENIKQKPPLEGKGKD